MKQVAEHLFSRGKFGKLYCRVRIPQKLRAAYGQTAEILRALGTSDVAEGKRRLVAELANIYAEFDLKQQSLDSKEAKRLRRSAHRLASLSDGQVDSLARTFVHQALLGDDIARTRGLSDDEFDELGDQLEAQRKELGRMLSQGRTEKILPAMHGFMHLLGIEVELGKEQERQVAYKFLEAVVQTLDIRLERQAGRVVPTSAHQPAQSVQQFQAALAPADTGPTWDEVFKKWNDYVAGRPPSTIIAQRTPWRELMQLAKEEGINSPAGVSKKLVTHFVDKMVERKLSTDTINDRLAKVKAIYKIAVSKMVLEANPAADVVGRGKSGLEKRKKNRVPFDVADLSKIFGCDIYTDLQRRSKGNSKEASYWIPLMMYYGGGRTEEFAGLALVDIVSDANVGWYFNLIDRPEPDDAELFDEEESKKVPHPRTLKNRASIRKVPIAQELIDLGLLRYVDYVRAQGEKALFPTLTKDTHGKLSGAFGKFFGRLKQELGINDPKKVLYSFRHTFKDTLERAEIPSRYLKRLMGHTSGDGHVTDGYGSDLPFDVMCKHFREVKFLPIAARPWQPGRGDLEFPNLQEKNKTKAAAKKKK